MKFLMSMKFLVTLTLAMMGQNPSMDFLWCDCAEAPLVAPALVAGVRTGITLAASARNVRRLAKTYWA